MVSVMEKKNRSRKRDTQRIKDFLRCSAGKYFLALFIGLIIIGFSLKWLEKNFLPIRKVVFIGNKHISESELRTLSGFSSKTSGTMTNISASSIKVSLMKSPWIRNVSIRRELPDVLKIKVCETEPLAILEMRGRPFLIDNAGRLLEELRGVTVPFLPVILSDPFKNQESFAEAVKLAMVLRERNIAKERGRVEIVANRDKESLSVVIDGVLIKVGYGEYSKKFERLFELENKLRKRAMAVEYIDLRFSDNAIVKPVKEIVR